MFNSTHFFEVNDNIFAIDFRKIFFCRLDKDTSQQLKLLSSVKANDFEWNPSDELAALAQNGYFISKYNEKIVPRHEYDLMNFSFAPIHGCNLACRYCFAQEADSTKNNIPRGQVYYTLTYFQNS